MNSQPSSSSVAKSAEASKTTSPEIRLLPAALFFTANSNVPAGIRARDMTAMVQGLVDEHSPLPIEMTAWGFLLDNKAKTDSHFLYYAAPRDLLFKNAEAAADLRPAAVLPAFASLQGLHFKRPTWIFLRDTECLSAVRFEAGSSVPVRILARFHEEGEGSDDDGSLFELRQKLLEAAAFDPATETAMDGVVQVGEARFDRKGLHFKLEHKSEPNKEWRSWKKTSIPQKIRRFAADVRDREALAAHQRNEGSGRRILQIAALVLLAVLVLAAFEVVQYQRVKEAAMLSEKAQNQTALVDRLQEIEAMSKSLKEIFNRRFEPYRWLMVVNAGRPEKVAFTSFALDASGTLSASGGSPEVQALNDYVAALSANPKFAEVALLNLSTDRDGATFSLRIKTGDIEAEPEPELELEPKVTPELDSEPEAAPAEAAPAEAAPAEAAPAEAAPAEAAPAPEAEAAPAEAAPEAPTETETAP